MSELKIGAKCSCRSPLPWHMFEIGPLTHVCRCGKTYKGSGDTVQLVGVSHNPFAAYDKAQRKRAR